MFDFKRNSLITIVRLFRVTRIALLFLYSPLYFAERKRLVELAIHEEVFKYLT